MYQASSVCMLLTATSCCFEAFAEAPVGDLTGTGLSSGYPMRFVDTSAPRAGAELNELALSIVPSVSYFQSLKENRELCDRGQVEGWSMRALRSEAGPPPDVIAGWVRRGALLRRTAAFCPQAVLLMLIRHVECVLLAPMAADMQEASVVHLKYGLLTGWLRQHVFPHEPWDLVVRGWGLEEREARFFGAYQRMLTRIYNDASQVDQPEAPLAAAAPSARGLGFPVEIMAACPGALTAPRVRFTEAPPAVEGPVPVGMVELGNALSLYWNARGLAQLAGVGFSATGGLSAGHFIRRLPRVVPPPPRGNATALAAACAACSPREAPRWRWPHTCLGAWTQIRGAIQRDTHEALRASGAEGAALARLGASDVAVHLRCFPGFKSNYPLAAFSLYADLPGPWRDARDLRFLLFGGRLSPACTQVAAALEGHLRRLFPQARVLWWFNTTEEALEADLIGAGAEDAVEADFATMVHAPVLVRAPSSFSLWAALARRRGAVLSAANPPAAPSGSSWAWRRARFGRDWRWSEAPLLTPEVVERHGFDFHRPGPWIEWLRSH